jgi:hypothetical protein
MSRGVFTPVIVRPTFNYFQIVNPRMFETPAANTIPLFALDRSYVTDIYGEAASELVLDGNATERIADVMQRPDYYADIVRQLRKDLAEKHSFEVRVKELVEVAQN